MRDHRRLLRSVCRCGSRYAFRLVHDANDALLDRYAPVCARLQCRAVLVCGYCSHQIARVIFEALVMNLNRLPFANLRYRMGRTVGLVILVALLAFIAYGGALVVSSLQNGLASLEARLGADIMVAPMTAKSKVDLEKVLVEGVPGSFYMDAAFLDEIAALDGVEKVSPQYYLATAKAGCCSMPVQVIGFDPDTDFTVQPWIARTYGGDLGRDDVVVGCNITGAPGATIKLYGVECTIISKLEETGTSLDNAVYATNDTLRDLMAGSTRQGLPVLADRDPDEVVSTILVKVANGYSVEAVTDDINLHVRGAWAERTRTMTSGVSDGVAGTSRLVGALMAAMWLLAVVLLIVVFTVVGRGRTREFAVLRVVGASRKALARVVLVESVAVSVVGALAGILLALLLTLALNPSIELLLGLPFLMPSFATLAGFAGIVFVVTVIAGPAASAFSVLRLSKVDPGQILREE